MRTLPAHRRRVPAQYLQSRIRVGVRFVAAADTDEARLAFATPSVDAAARLTRLRAIGGVDLHERPAALCQLVGKLSPFALNARRTRLAASAIPPRPKGRGFSRRARDGVSFNCPGEAQPLSFARTSVFTESLSHFVIQP